MARISLLQLTALLALVAAAFGSWLKAAGRMAGRDEMGE